MPKKTYLDLIDSGWNEEDLQREASRLLNRSDIEPIESIFSAMGERRFNVNFLIDDENNMPLHKVAKMGNENLVKILLEAGAEGKALNSAGNTPKQIAHQAGYKELAGKFDSLRREVKLKPFLERVAFLEKENRELKDTLTSVGFFRIPKDGRHTLVFREGEEGKISDVAYLISGHGGSRALFTSKDYYDQVISRESGRYDWNEQAVVLGFNNP